MILLAAAAAGLVAGGIGFGLRKLSGNRIGKWIIPASAGLGILLFQISYEYSWYDNQLLHQPEGSVVVATENTPIFFRPWTFFFPLTTAYTLLEPRDIVYQEQTEPYARIAQFYLYRIEKAPQEVMKYQQHLLNCSNGELIQLNKDQQIDANVKMRVLDKNSTLYKEVCR